MPWSDARLPLDIETPRTDDFDPVLRLPGNQDGCSDIACIQQVLTRGEVSLLKFGMDRLRHRLIGPGSRSRGHMRDEVGQVLLTGFGQMDGCHRNPATTLVTTTCRIVCKKGFVEI